MSEPVLSAEEWATGEVAFTARLRDDALTIWGENDEYGVTSASVHAEQGAFPIIIALANAALPDSDPAKITRETIALLWEAVGKIDADSGPITAGQSLGYRLSRLADALERLLPPA